MHAHTSGMSLDPNPNNPNNVTQTQTTAASSDATAGGGASQSSVEGGAGAAPARRPTVDDLPEHVLKIRLDQVGERAKRELLAQYGVATQEELDAKLKKVTAYEEAEKKRAAEEEAKKRESMSSEEKLRDENTQLKARVTQLETENAQLKGRLGGLRFGQTVRTIATDYIRADMREDACALFATHVKAIAEEGDTVKLRELETPGGVRKYFRDLATKKPVYALEGSETTQVNAAGAKPPVKTPPPKKPITTGASPAKVTPPAGATAGTGTTKTMRPGRPNSMSDKEVGEAVKKKWPGVHVPGLTT